MSLASSPVAALSTGRPTLVVTNPSGIQSRVELLKTPFRLGRQADNDLVLRDSRISRRHAEILKDENGYRVEDCNSAHGLWVNGERVASHVLRHGDQLHFGSDDSYQITFESRSGALERAMTEIDRNPAAPLPHAENLTKLRAIMEIARALETAFSMEEVFATLVDAALAVTGTERGFLLLKKGEGLDIAVARDNAGKTLPDSELRVPTSVIRRALHSRRDLLTMNFDPLGETGLRPEHTAAALDLRSVVCVPLVRIRAGNVNETTALSSSQETVGLIYLDSRSIRADLSSGNRELLATLALEASTVLDNARLLEEQRDRQRMEEELKIARTIQQSLLPRELPETGWFQAGGQSIPSYQVGGDYFDIRPIDLNAWAVVVADVSGKGVSSALLASLLQGVFLSAAAAPHEIEASIVRLNKFLLERTGGEKYATLFYGAFSQLGRLHYVNAGHCAPLLLSRSGEIREIPATGMPLGWFEEADYQSSTIELMAGDRLVVFSDGVTEARNPQSEFYGEERLRELLAGNSRSSCRDLVETIRAGVETFTAGAAQRDDITIVVCEYLG